MSVRRTQLIALYVAIIQPRTPWGVPLRYLPQCTNRMLPKPKVTGITPYSL